MVDGKLGGGSGGESMHAFLPGQNIMKLLPSLFPNFYLESYYYDVDGIGVLDEIF